MNILLFGGTSPKIGKDVSENFNILNKNFQKIFKIKRKDFQKSKKKFSKYFEKSRVLKSQLKFIMSPQKFSKAYKIQQRLKRCQLK